MSCKRCPHHVRHGAFSSNEKTVTFKELCGLKMKRDNDPDAQRTKPRGRGRPAAEPVKRVPLGPGETVECINYPFSEDSDFYKCPVYQAHFQSQGMRNGVMPTKDFHFFETLASDSITEMELL